MIVLEAIWVVIVSWSLVELAIRGVKALRPRLLHVSLPGEFAAWPPEIRVSMPSPCWWLRLEVLRFGEDVSLIILKYPFGDRTAIVHHAPDLPSWLEERFHGRCVRPVRRTVEEIWRIAIDELVEWIAEEREPRRTGIDG